MKNDVFPLKERILLEGVMPERALLRLRRAGIAIFDAKKTQKDQILFSVRKKDAEKVFAVYPNRQGFGNGSVYRAKGLGGVGFAKSLDFFKKRIGLFLGAVFCLIVALATNPFVFSIETLGADGYKREILSVLDEAGIRPFARYNEREIDGVCAKLLALDGVEYCSVKKTGGRVVVEMRESPFQTRKTNRKQMTANHTGEIVAMTVLRGTPLKKIGEKTTAGEILVDNCFYTEDGGQVRVEIIARVRIACAWEGSVEAESAEEAFAKAYLCLGLTNLDELKSKEIEEKDGLYQVKIGYEVVEKINF